jgi:CrcB protein
MITAVWVALGGAVGSLARYGLAGALNDRAHPLGTVAVNIAGSFAVGILAGYWGFHVDSPMRIGLTVGVLGGFTTFSTFAVDAIYIWEKGEINLAIASVLGSVILGIAAAAAGIIVGRSLSI